MCTLICHSLSSSSISPIYQGTTLSATEATETFFAITKLFQSNDIILRRLVYLAIKEMATISNDVIIVTSRYKQRVN